MPTKKNKKKTASRRENEKHPNLDPRFNLKTRSDLLDQDYLHKLNEKELDWLNKFNKEYINAALDNERPKKNLHKTKKLRKECYDRNNARNRDILTRAKASNQLAYELHPESVLSETVSGSEDELIEAIDSKEVANAITWLSEEIDKDEKTLEKTLIQELKDREEP